MDNFSNKYDEYKALVKELNYHTSLYNQGEEEITDTEWDNLYFKVKAMEKELGMISMDSPTQKIVFSETLDHLDKYVHGDYPMISLDKTKNIDEILSFIKKSRTILMPKLDGLSCALIYKNGRLAMAATRGNGEIGELITHNVQVLNSVPKNISDKADIIVHGEIICKTDIFQKYFANEYKNPRNFASGSIRLLDSKESHKRRLTFVAWDLVQGGDSFYTLSDKLDYMTDLGFETAPWALIENQEDITKITAALSYFNYPLDGLVYKYDNIEYYKSLGSTAHHPLGAMAFKFQDETAETVLKDIEWTMGRTGVLTPVAIFDTVELEGTEVSRASLHNLSIIHNLAGDFPRIGDKLIIAKMNQIIPQVTEWENNNGKALEIPARCPICNGFTEIRCDNESEFLYCSNPNCEGQLLNKLDHFCSKKGLDIKGLSSATLQKLIDMEWIEEFEDIFDLVQHKDEWAEMAGFGEKSVKNILTAIEASRECTLESFISAIGIPLVGVNVAKELCKYFNSWEEFISAVEGDYRFWELDGFGEEKHFSIKNFDYSEAKKVATRLKFLYNINVKEKEEQNLKDKTIVITGTLKNYKNREELKKDIEARGGKVTGSVSAKTSYLINNDVNSGTNKNATARQLNVPILSEAEFIEKFLK